MSPQTTQLTLFSEAGKSEADSEWKRFDSAEGIAVRYRYTGEKTIGYELPNGETGEVSRQSQNRWYVAFTNADGKRVGLQGRGNDPKNALVALIAAYQVREATLLARCREAEAAQAREREREAVEKLIRVTTHGIDAQPADRAEEEKPGKKVSAKLCQNPVPITWEQRRYIPSKAGGHFARTPEKLIARSTDFAAGEFRVFLASIEMATGTGRVWGKETLARIANVHPKDVKMFRESLANRGLMRRTGEKEGRAFVWELLTNEDYGLTYHANASKSSTGIEGGTSAGMGGTSGSMGGTFAGEGGTVPPQETILHQTASKEELSRVPSRNGGRPTKAPVSAPTSENRSQRRGKESEKNRSSDLNYTLDRIRDLVGLKELMPQPEGSLGLWHTYYQEDAVALNEAIGEIKNRVASGVVIKKSAAAALTHEYKRIRDERARTR